MQLRPRHLNAAVAGLFMVGSACFALGTVPWYLGAVGSVADATTFFIGSLFFTSASFGQLLQAQSPAMAPNQQGNDMASSPVVAVAWHPRDHGWLGAATQFPGTLAFNVSTVFAIATTLTEQQAHRLVWRPDFVGSILFLVSSLFGILAVGRLRAWMPGSTPWQIAWLNMIGSILFMVSAIASYVLPQTGTMLDVKWANLGTFLGAVCFLVGAALMLPAWTEATRRSRPATQLGS